MTKLRITGKFESDCKIIGYQVLSSTGKNLKISATKMEEMIDKDMVEGGKVIQLGQGKKYYYIDPEIIKSVESIKDKRNITARVVRNNERKDIIGYKVDGKEEIVTMNRLWIMVFNGMIENAEVRVKSSKSGKTEQKLLIINTEVSTEVLDY